MRDYNSITNSIRICFNSDENHGCTDPRNECDYKSLDACAVHLMSDAADAIEELLDERDKYKAYVDNVSSLPDCNVCLKQSVCEFVPAWGENTRINCPLALTEPPKEVSE